MKIYQRIARKATAFLVSLALAAIAVPASFTVSAAQRCEKKATGTFIQSWLCQSWSDAKWETELDYMDQAGMTYLIYSDVAYRDSGTWTTKYPSQISGLAGTNGGLDVIENVLRNCARHNIKVFIGMGYYSEFEVNGGIGSTFTDFCNISAQIVTEIYNRYYSRYQGTFYGWYFVPEFNNNYLNMTPFVSTFASGMNVVLNTLTGLNPNLPMLMSPYYMKYYTTANVSDTRTFWENMFTQINFRPGDIFAPQDAVGAGWIELCDLGTITSMYREAVDAVNKGIILWSNCESFTQNHDSSLLGPPATENTTFITSPLNRYVQQMTVVSQYVDNIIMFSYNHYYSPNQCNPVFNNTYLNYLANGTLETQCPTAPTRIDTALQSDGSLKLTWSGATDNIGIAAYRVLKNGSFAVRNDVSDPGLTTYTDSSFSTSGRTTYEIQTIDGAGNASSYAKIVIDGANPNAYVDSNPSDQYKCVAGIDNIAAGIRPGVNDTNGYFNSMSGNGTNYVVETADGVGYQGSRGLRYSVPSTASADVWVSWKLLPPSYTMTSARGANSFYYWVDTTNMGSNQLSHMVLISENDTAANETTVWTLKSTASLYIENGRGGFIKIASDSGNVKYPVGYKGFVQIPLTEFTPTYGTTDSNSSWGLDSINYIQFAYNSYDEWKGCSAAFDSFGFRGGYTDGSAVPTEFYKYANKNIVGFDSIAAGTKPGVNDTAGCFNNVSGNGTNYLLEVTNGSGYKGTKGLKYSVPSTASANAWVSLQMLAPSFSSTSAAGAKEAYFWIDTTGFTNSFAHQFYFSEYDAAANETTVWGLNSTGVFYVEDGVGGFTQKTFSSGSLSYTAGYKGYVKVPFSSMSPKWNTPNANGQAGLDGINYIWIAFNSYSSDKNEYVCFDNFGFNGLIADGVKMPTQFG